MKKAVLFAIVISIVLTCSLTTAAFAETSAADYKSSQSYTLVKEICDEIPDRQAGKNEQTAIWLQNKIGELTDGGITAEVQRFTLVDTFGYNVSVLLPAKVSCGKQIIIGAHYDAEGQGAGDNAAGVAAALMIMQRLYKSDALQIDVRFVLFDAEESGFVGSQSFLAAMTQTDIDNTLVMFNLDSIANGDNLYLWCENKRTDLAELITSKSDMLREKPYAKGTFNLANYYYGYTEIPQNSDHTPFRLAGIPTALFFSGTYDAKPWNYAESKDPNKNVMNSAQDTFDNLDKYNGAQFVDKINAVVNSVEQTVLDGEFVTVAANQRAQLVNLKVWYQPWWARLVCAVVFAILVVLAVLYYRKLQKNAILGTAEVKNNSVFSTPQAEDIFAFGDKKTDGGNPPAEDVFTFDDKKK